MTCDQRGGHDARSRRVDSSGPTWESAYDGGVTSLSPTGIQFHLTRGGVTAQISQVGAALRGLTVDGVDIVPPYPIDIPAPLCAGVVLVPWPNRIRDGLWDDEGTERALAITEPKLNNAIHGLLRYSPYEIAEQTDDRITLRAAVFPQAGYPYLLETSVTYALGERGVTVTHAITNRSEEAAPVAVGTHPFLTIGDVDPRELVLTVPAGTFIETDDRLLPTAELPVTEGTDLREGKRLGDLDLDTAFAEVTRDEDGLVRSTLAAPDGRTVTLWQGEGFDYLQVYTTDELYPGQDFAVAVEPMTALMDAFNTGRSIRRLSTGETWTLHWGVDFTA